MSKKKSIQFTIDQWVKAMEKKEIVMIGKNALSKYETTAAASKQLHHPTELQDGSTYTVKSDIMKISGGITSVAGDDGGRSYYAFADMYKTYPIADETSKDAILGTKMKNALLQFREHLGSFYDNDPALKEYVFKTYDQKEKVYDEEGNVTLKDVALAKTRIKMPFTPSKFQKGHEKEGEVDPSRSPTVRFHIWTGRPKQNDDGTGLPQFLIDGGRKVLYTRITDLHRHGAGAKPITALGDFLRYVYASGDLKAGKPRYTLYAKLEWLAPSIYFKPGALGDIQLKLKSMEIYAVERENLSYEVTEEEKMTRLIEMQELYGTCGIKPYDPNEDAENTNENTAEYGDDEEADWNRRHLKKPRDSSSNDVDLENEGNPRSSSTFKRVKLPSQKDHPVRRANDAFKNNNNGKDPQDGSDEMFGSQELNMDGF